MEIEFANGVMDILNERGISVEDVERTISYSEKEKTFIVDDGKIIGKYRMENMTVYVSYEKKGNLNMVHSAYSHRVHLTSEQE